MGPAFTPIAHNPRTYWKYQLIFQFPFATVDQGWNRDLFRGAWELAAWINGALLHGELAEYDACILDADAAALFVHTDAPRAAFRRLRPLVDEHAAGFSYFAAYRAYGTDDYTILAHRDASVSASREPEPGRRYQLVIQFPFEDVDLVFIIDQSVERALAGSTSAELDGHDIGSNQMNVFIRHRHTRSDFQGAPPGGGESGSRCRLPRGVS
jgi:hypothetical protein